MILRVKTLIVHIRGGRGRGGWVSTISNTDECKVNLCETVCLVILNLLNKVCSIDININPPLIYYNYSKIKNADS